MPIWSDNTINRFALEAENEFATATNCIVDRYSPAVTAYLSTYQLPSYVISVRRVTWMGKKLEPLPFRSLMYYPIVNPLGTNVSGGFDRLNFDNNGFSVGGFTDTSPSINNPYAYFYQGFGENVVKLFPTPSQSLPAGTTLWDSDPNTGIGTCCIIEFYRYPDVTTTNFRIPSYVRRRSIKAYVLWKCFAQEGIGQDLKASEYWHQKYLLQVTIVQNILSGVFTAKFRARTPEANRFATRISRPRLPTNFGTVLG